MSTAARELEELRRIREAQRIEAEEENKKQEALQQKQKRRNSFLARAAAFQPKPTKTDEEIKQTVQKASKERKFKRQLNKALESNPDQNTVALELGLKNKIIHGFVPDAPEYDPMNTYIDKNWEIVHQEGGPPYYWNRKTNETTYDPPTVNMDINTPPPPPPRHLPGLGSGPVKKSPWVYVYENEETPYFWNTETNDTTFDQPEDYVEEHAAESAVECAEEATGESSATVMWQESIDENGEYSYFNIHTGETVLERPNGTLIIVLQNENGEEENWHEKVYEGGDETPEDELSLQQENDAIGMVFYQNILTGEIKVDKPEGGFVLIAET